VCRWAHRLRRIARTSPLSAAPGWGLAPLIVKSGDDCRQELLALQLVAEAREVWAGEQTGRGTWGAVELLLLQEEEA
jgi:phosphatidylinositol 4-kinase